jgi:hypothetical protein
MRIECPVCGEQFVPALEGESRPALTKLAQPCAKGSGHVDWLAWVNFVGLNCTPVSQESNTYYVANQRTAFTVLSSLNSRSIFAIDEAHTASGRSWVSVGTLRHSTLTIAPLSFLSRSCNSPSLETLAGAKTAQRSVGPRKGISRMKLVRRIVRPGTYPNRYALVVWR